MKTHVIPPEIGLELAREDFERGAFSDTVRAYESKDLAWSGRW